jgi:hypothetical protein
VGHVAHNGEKINAYRILVGRKIPLEDLDIDRR